MGAPAKTTKQPRPRKREGEDGHTPAAATANGHARTRQRKDRKQPGQTQFDPLARDLIAAVTSSAVNGAADSEPRVTKAQARKIAVEFGGAMLEATNVETAEHSDDVVVLARAICENLGVKGARRQDILAAARLHDIGKAAIPVEIIEKPGPLDDGEWELMRQHTEIGHQILGAVAELENIATLVRHSHERWDGGGYPDGLAGEAIPLGSRVIFVADAFHAIRSDRPYRPGRTAAQSMAEVKRGAGTQFDPSVVEAFETVAKELKLAPSTTAYRRSSRLTALLLMLAIGTGGSAIAASGVLDAQSASAAPDARGTSFAQGQMLGLSFDDAIRVSRAPVAGSSVLFGGPGASGLGAADGQRGRDGSSVLPGDGQTRPSQDGSGSGSEGDGSAGSPGASDSSRGESGGDHPQGGPPGQTGNHPQGGPPGQTGKHPQGGPPGQTGNHPQGGPPGQSGKSPGGSSGNGGSSGTSGGSGSSGSPGNSGSNGNGPPGGAGPPGQSKKPK